MTNHIRSLSSAVIHVGSPSPDFLFEDVKLVHFHDFENSILSGGVFELKSPAFCCAGSTWGLEISGGGPMEGKVSVYLTNLQEREIVASCDVMFLMRDDRLFKKRTSEKKVFDEDWCWGWERFTTLDDLMDAAHSVFEHGCLTVEVRIRPEPDYSCHSAPQKYSYNMMKIFLSEDSADVAFRVKDAVIPAHRAVLLAQAPELAELCDAFDMTNPMPIPDVDPTIFTICSLLFMANVFPQWIGKSSHYLLFLIKMERT